MQVSVENTGKLGRKMKVEIPEDKINDQVDKKLQEMSRGIRIKGFRPGKVPAKVVRQRYGKQARQEVIGDIMQESYSEALQQNNLTPAGNPRMTDTVTENGLSYTVEFEVFPELDDVKVEALKIEKIVSEVEDKDIDAMIDSLKQQKRNWEEVDRPADEGDLVVFEFLAKGRGYQYPEDKPESMGAILGTGGLVKAMEEALVGKSANDEMELSVTFPKDYRVEALAGKKPKVSMKVVRVSEAALPEVDEAFMASFGVPGGDVQKFRDEIKNNLGRELENAVAARLRTSVMEALLAKYSKFELPESLVEEEAGMLREQGADEDKAREAAEKRVRSALLLRQIASQAKIQPDPQKIQQIIASVASTYEKPQEVVNYYLSNQEAMAQVQQQAMEDQVVEWIAEQAESKEVKMPFAEVLKPA